MRAAIYARKSTAHSWMSEDDRSVERQKARAHAYATAHGWTVAEEHVYEDDGISGAEFDRRPGLQRLLIALKRRALFRILIVMDESRLVRESIETSHVLKQFSLCGIRVFAYLDDREVLLDNLMDKMRLAFTGLMDEGERYRAQQRTFDAMHRKALRGHVTGGRVYGYDNVEVMSSVLDAYGRPKRDHVERIINQEQAAVVRRIFNLCAEESTPDRRVKTRSAGHNGNMEFLRRRIHDRTVYWLTPRKFPDFKTSIFSSFNASDTDILTWVKAILRKIT